PAANAEAGTAAPEVLRRLTPEPRSRWDGVRGDGKYRNRALARSLCREQVSYQVTVVERPAGAQGLVQLPYRWVIERTNAWTGKYRRNSKDYERTTSSSEAMGKIAMIHLILRHLNPYPPDRPADFHYPP